MFQSYVLTICPFEKMSLNDLRHNSCVGAGTIKESLLRSLEVEYNSRRGSFSIVHHRSTFH